MMNKNINVPNAISVFRLLLAPVMVVCIINGKHGVFPWVLLTALTSDILDGAIARIFHLQTRLGAVLDAMADMGMYLCAVAGIFVFESAFIGAHRIEIAVILGFYCAEKIKSFVAYRKAFNAFHTYLSKATAYLQGAFIMSLFFWGFKGYLFYPAMAVSIMANIEEMILSSIIPAYESNVRGLFWFLRGRREQA